MKKKISLILVLCFVISLCFSIPVSAIENTEDIVVSGQFTFKLNEEGNGYILIGYNAAEGGKIVEIPAFPDFSKAPYLSLVEIDTNVFKGVNVVSITIPETVKKMTGDGFAHQGTQKVYIKSLVNWCNIEFSNNQSNPLYTLPFGSGSELYLNGKLVEDLVIPDGITEINPHTFANCNSIKTITIPKSVKKIGVNAFGDNNNLKHIYYVATEEAVAEIEISNGAFSDECTPFIHYNCKEHTVTYKSTTAFCIDTVKAECSCGYSWLVSRVQNEHRYVGNCCDNCGKSVWGYKELDDGNICVYDYFNSEEKNVVIPSEIDGKTVVALDFKDAKNIIVNAETIVVPDTVKNISNVFINYLGLNTNSDLQRIVLPESVTQISGLQIGKTITVMGVPGSKAEELANQKGFEFVDMSTIYSVNVKNAEIVDGMFVVDEIEKTEIQNVLKPTGDYSVSVTPKYNGVYSTGTKVSVQDKDGVTLKEHTLVVKGDTNGDGVCDVLDCMLVELARNNNTTLAKSAFLASDLAENNEITVEDYQAIVEKAIA